MGKPKHDPAEEEAAKIQRKSDGAALGKRLRGARTLAGETLESTAKKLCASGILVGKAAVGHWETGHSLPDALQIRRLAKLYGTTVDALMWDDSISIEAIRFAAQFDALNERQQRTFRAMWLAYFEQAKTDAEVDEAWKNKPAGVPLPPSPPPSAPPPPAPPGGAAPRRMRVGEHLAEQIARSKKDKDEKDSTK